MRIPRYNEVPALPTPNHVVRVWWHTVEVDAVWTGREWRTPDGALLQGPITHWRER